jgi:hypothetical protein
MRIIFLVFIKLLFVSFCFSQKQNKITYSIIKSTTIQNSFSDKYYSNKKSATLCTYIPKKNEINKANQNLIFDTINKNLTIDTLNVLGLIKTIPINTSINYSKIQEKQTPIKHKLNSNNNLNYKNINDDSLDNTTSNLIIIDSSNTIQNLQLTIIQNKKKQFHKSKPVSINKTINNNLLQK